MAHNVFYKPGQWDVDCEEFSPTPPCLGNLEIVSAAERRRTGWEYGDWGLETALRRMDLHFPRWAVSRLSGVGADGWARESPRHI